MAKIKKRVGGRKATARNSNSELNAVIDDLVTANRIVYHQGVVDGFGHISVRDPRDPERFLMSRARAPGLVTAADILVFGLDGEPVKKDAPPIYGERFIHSEIYKARPDVNAVLHSHSPTVIPFSITNVPMRPIRVGFLYPEVPVFDTRDAAGWTDLLISNQVLGKALAEKLGSNSVVLLRGHGNAVVGPDLQITVYRAVYTEANAKQQLQAMMLGGPITFLAPEEAMIMNAARARRKPGLGADRIWELLKAEAFGTAGRRKS